MPRASARPCRDAPVQPSMMPEEYFFCMLQYFLKGFFADVVLYFTGIGCRRLFIHAQSNEKAGEQLVAVIYAGGYFIALVCQGDKTLSVHFDITVLTQLFHGHADARLFEVLFVHHIDRAHHAQPFLQDKDGFQIIFCRFMNDQSVPLPYFIRKRRPGGRPPKTDINLCTDTKLSLTYLREFSKECKLTFEI